MGVVAGIFMVVMVGLLGVGGWHSTYLICECVPHITENVVLGFLGWCSIVGTVFGVSATIAWG